MLLARYDVREAVDHAPDAEPDGCGHAKDDVLEPTAIAAYQLARRRQPARIGAGSAASLSMHHLHLRHVPYPPGRPPHPLTPLHVLAVHEEPGIEEPDPLDRLPAHHHARAAYPVDRNGFRPANEATLIDEEPAAPAVRECRHEQELTDS